MAISKEEQLKEAWLAYFKNIQKENDLIRIILEYYKALEIEINKINSNSQNRKDDRYEDDRQLLFAQKQKEESSILPKYVEYINRKELRQYLSKVKEEIENFRKKINSSEISISANFKKQILYFDNLLEKLNELKQETKNYKPKIDKNKFTSIYLENFKGFAKKDNREENFIKLRPITLIYGPNSYGKSSILQSLLLLNQTVKEGKDFNNINLLANGDTVKMGEFKYLINKNDIDKELRIEISLPYNHYFNNVNDGKKQDTSILTKLFIAYCFSLYKKQVILSKVDISAILIDYYEPDNTTESQKKLIYTLEPVNPGQDNKFKITRHFNNSDEVFLGDDLQKQEVEKISFFRFEEFLYEDLFKQIEETINNLIYVSSFRTQPERYYVPENNRRIYVGKNGEYTAEILGYDKKVSKYVDEWLKEIAGYNLVINKDDVVNSVNLNDKRTKVENINLLDLGSGIAQVLPIITQAFKSENETILVEEPEIHLHPKAQAELGEMFAKAAKTKGNTFIIETHSENLLLRLEKLIRKGELSKDDVSVIYVDKNENGSYCIPLLLDDEGDITNINDVPDGFFEEGFDELFDIKK
ncbi:MAG: AAA family ATPase [Candidatus Gastranaerophilaceae bacterium]|nr:AAA family ATPase [Candidatus Gastranaerophilaceae bacterium]